MPSMIRSVVSNALASNTNNTNRITIHHKRIATIVTSSSSSNGSSYLTIDQTYSTHKQQYPTRRTFTSLNQCTPYNICFLRHGQSTWNRDNRFIGWTDTPLTDQGVLEARVAGQMLHNSNIQFDEVHTSLLRRSIRTTNIVLMEMAQEYIPVYKHWRLNERNYGALTGLNKKECVAQHGVDQVKRWRRSYDEPPPPMPDDHEYNPRNDPRYRNMLHKIPKSESLKCTVQRSSVYWDSVIAPALRDGKTILVVGHENNLRSLIMRLENIAPSDVINLSLPRAVPLAYKLDLETLQPINVRADGSLDSATGFLRGQWLGGDDSVTEILKRDHKQVYDTTITTNLEIGSNSKENGKEWKKVANGLQEILPGAKAMGNETAGSFLGTAPVVTSSLFDPICQHNGGNFFVQSSENTNPISTTTTSIAAAVAQSTSSSSSLNHTLLNGETSSSNAKTTTSTSNSNTNHQQQVAVA